MKNVYGYDSYLDVPVPEGEKKIDIRIPQDGERILNGCGDSLYGQVVNSRIADLLNVCGGVRIILAPKPNPRYMTIKVEIPEEIPTHHWIEAHKIVLGYPTGINDHRYCDAKVVETTYEGPTENP